jgi:multidrug efflux pump subunit AcrA (membrane-fusion protein)
MIAMKEVLKNLLPLVLLVGGVIGCMILINLREDPARETPESLIPVVEVETVENHAGNLKLRVDGVVTPFREITLSAQVAGRITYKSDSCRPGKFVAKGENLLVIDPRDYQLEINRLHEELAQAQASRAELEVQITNARDLLANSQQELRLQRNELEREQQLSATSATSRSRLDQAERAVLTSQNQVIELNNQIRLFERQRIRLDSITSLVKSKRDRALLDLERTKVVSPVNGVVVQEFIEQDALAQQGTNLVTIEDTSAVEVKCNLQSEELYWIWSQAKQFRPQDRYDLPPLPATVTYEAGGRTYRWQGKLSRYDGIGFDQRTRMVPCRILVDEPFLVSAEESGSAYKASTGQPIVPALMRGMFVTVELEVQPAQNLLSVDQRAIQPTGEVIVANFDPPAGDSAERQGVARMMPVKVLYHDGQKAVVVSLDDSLQAGDQVIVTPLPGASPFELREGGVKVRMAQTSGEPHAAGEQGATL